MSDELPEQKFLVVSQFENQAEKLSKERRQEIAKKAAKKRWGGR